MAELSFECIDVQPDRYGSSPTLLFRLRISELGGLPVHAIALRCQIRIEPQRRRYDDHEAAMLVDLFGERARWGDTLKPMQFANVSLMVPSFTGSTEIDLPVPCTYDVEVSTGKYFHGLDDGEVPMMLMFSGTLFGKGEQGFWVEQVPWHLEARYRLPIETWQAMMDLYFPDSGWIRMRRDTLDAMLRYKSRHAIPTWDEAMDKLLAQAGEAGS